MRRSAVALLGLCAAPIVGAGAPCGAALTGSVQRVEDARYVVAYVVTPEPIAVGSHFVVDFAVCARGGAPAPDDVRIDATMPEHRHGMNYRPTVTARAPGVYRAEGMLFHMPGRWDVTFDIAANGSTNRVVGMVRVE